MKQIPGVGRLGIDGRQRPLGSTMTANLATKNRFQPPGPQSVFMIRFLTSLQGSANLSAKAVLCQALFSVRARLKKYCQKPNGVVKW
jgi:hypothetical protein